MIEKNSLESFHSSRNEVHVWVVPTELDNFQRGLFDGFLSDDEREKAGRFFFGKDQKRYRTAHGALRLLLGHYTGLAPSELSFAQGKNGKPFLRQSGSADEVLFNMSHSGDYTVIAATKGRSVGVDIEVIRSNVEYLDMTRQFFSPSECAWLAGQPPSEQLVGFFRLWVVKEAFLKAMGVGLSTSLNEAVVTFKSNDGVELQYADTDLKRTRWVAEEMKLIPGYASAVVVEESAETLRAWTMTESGSSELQFVKPFAKP